MHAYAQYKSNGTLWPAGRTILGLCAAWNHAMDPTRPMTDAQQTRADAYARAIIRRMRRLGFVYGRDYCAISNGTLWPINAR